MLINFFGTNISVTNPQLQKKQIDRLLKLNAKGYVTYSNVHVIVESIKNSQLQKVVNNAAIASPDGMPLVVIGKILGAKIMQKCSGPDMMINIIKGGLDKGYKHYFFGNTEEVLDELTEKLYNKYPNIQIVGSYSPPFRKLSEHENSDIIKRINEVEPDCIWVSLGAPKQEIWMAEQLKDLKKGIMFGVGAAFNFITGDAKRAPLWMQKSGLEWLYRLLSEPQRLWKRYLTTNMKFLFYLLTKKVSIVDIKK